MITQNRNIFKICENPNTETCNRNCIPSLFTHCSIAEHWHLQGMTNMRSTNSCSMKISVIYSFQLTKTYCFINIFLPQKARQQSIQTQSQKMYTNLYRSNLQPDSQLDLRNVLELEIQNTLDRTPSFIIKLQLHIDHHHLKEVHNETIARNQLMNTL